MPTTHSATAPAVAVDDRAAAQAAGLPASHALRSDFGGARLRIVILRGPVGFVSSFTEAGSVPRFGIPLFSYSAIPVIVGVFLVVAELVFQLPKKRAHRRVVANTIKNRELTVVLTAYNDELSIGPSAADFLAHPMVRRVLVVDNNSSDRTAEVAAQAGATLIREETPGYGSSSIARSKRR
jgi:hypothetical protein